MSDLHFRTAAELGYGYRNGGPSPRDVVDALSQRVRQFDPVLHVMIGFDPDSVMRGAQQAEQEMAQGLDRGPLHGIPVAIKDVINVEGSATTCASAVMEGHRAEADAAVVQKLREAGAIIFGKTNTHEFACGGPSFDLPLPPARNPWNTQHHPGGSSSGSGAGVAAGLFPLAIGTDTGGSVRHPASACGIVGFKPTYGLVSRRGVFPLAHSLDCVGGLARTVHDAGLLLNGLIGQDIRESSSVTSSMTDCTHDIGKGLTGIRIGFARHFHQEDLDASSDTVSALNAAADVLKEAGASVEDIRLPRLETFFSVNRVLLSSEAFAIHAPMLREKPERYGLLARRALLAGAFLSSEDYISGQKLRTHLITQVDACFSRVDIILSASSMEPPSRLDDPVETRRTYTRQARTPFSVTGHPALTMMCGLSSSGLPLSLQLAARSFEEPLLLRVAAAYESRRGATPRPALSP